MEIRSMTGYGSAKGTVAGMELTAELKSVNNRYLDVNVRMPRGFLFAEESMKAAVAKHISRGKVDVFLTVNSTGSEDTVVRVNEPLLRAYLTALSDVSERYGLVNDLTVSSVSRFPDVLSVEKAETDQDELAAGLTALLEQALCDYDAMRIKEGSRLLADISGRLDTIEKLVGIVEERAPETAAQYEARLRQKMEAALEGKNVDESRIVAEAAIFADHIAVDEETVRLRSHIAQMRAMLKNGSPFGRKADFLIQEFNRESNTIGSKCQNAEIAKIVVELKSEIEKIREQIQNIE